jgi:hypothetical protein
MLIVKVKNKQFSSTFRISLSIQKNLGEKLDNEKKIIKSNDFWSFFSGK